MSVTHTHQTAIADDGSDVGANVWNADHTIAAPLTVPGTANTSSLVGTGYSLTGSNAQAMQSWGGTLNTSGVVDIFKLAITDTAHGALSTLLRLLGGASGTTDILDVFLAGHTYSGGQITLGNDNSGAFEIWATSANAKARSGSRRAYFADRALFPRTVGVFGIGPGDMTGGSDIVGSVDVGISSPAVGVMAVGTGAAGSTAGTLQMAVVRTMATVVGSLPAAATAGAGARAFVTDATVATFGSAAAGSGANKVPVWCDGTGWFIG